MPRVTSPNQRPTHRRASRLHRVVWTLAVVGGAIVWPPGAGAQVGAMLGGVAARLEVDQAQEAFRVARSAREFLGAARQYERVADRWERSRTWQSAAVARYFAGRAFAFAGRPDSALAALGRARADVAQQTERSGNRGVPGLVGGLFGLNRDEVASGTRPSTDSLIVGSVRREMGAVLQGLGRPDTALALYNSVTASCLDAQHFDPEEGSTPAPADDEDRRWQRSTAKRGDVLSDALHFYCVGTRVYDWTEIAAVLLDLGRPGEALEYLRRAEFAARGGRAAPRGVAARIEGAISAVIPDALEGARFTHEAHVRTTMAEAFVQLGQPDSAARQYERVIALYRPGRRFSQTRDWRGLTRALLGYGDLMLAAGARGPAPRDSALALYARALTLVRATGDVTSEALALHRLARAYLATAAPDAAARALAYFDSASVAKAHSRARAPGDENRLGVADRNAAIEMEWASALLRPLSVTAGAASNAPAGRRAVAALAALERGRARALLTFLGDSSIDGLPKPGADLDAEGDSLVRRVRATGRAVLTYMQFRDTLTSWLIPPTGQVLVTRRPLAADTLARLVARARAALAVDVSPVRGIAPPDDDARPDSVGRGVGVGVGVGVDGRATETLKALATALLPASLDAATVGAHELLVVPTGALHLVPFAALQTAADTVPMGIRLPLRFAPSLQTAIALDARVGASARQAVVRPLLVGNPAMPALPTGGGQARPLPPLPGAEAEIRWLAGRLGAEPLSGASATARAVRDRFSSSTLVHFATHGVVYSAPGRVRGSFVAVAPDSGVHSGLLTVAEILDDSGYTTHAELVVLSACETALGDVRQSEGVVGLQRAFVARGAGGVLASLWSVSDASTRLLMQRFYTHWLDDPGAPSAAQALLGAMRDVRNVPEFASPRFWASFQLVGSR